MLVVACLFEKAFFGFLSFFKLFLSGMTITSTQLHTKKNNDNCSFLFLAVLRLVVLFAGAFALI